MLWVRIGDLEVDERRRELRSSAGLVAAQPKVFDLLVYLVRERDRVVPREELLHALWSETSVGPDSITRALREVRRLLGQPEMVRTYPARGVRFVGSVVSLNREEATAAADVTGDLFGIDDSLASIAALLERTASGRGGLRILIGPPGCGKSTLLDIAERRARAAQFAVTRACRETLGAAVADAARTGRRTLVLHDDLPGDDAATIDAHRMASHVTNAPVAVVAACCSSARCHPRVRAMLAAAIRVDPESVVVVRALDPRALRLLAEHVLGRPISPAALAKLEMLTGGNPRFARHVLQLARQANRPLETLDSQAPRLAGSLRELVLEHVAVLSAEARVLLDGVSILDQPFTLYLAAEIAAIATGPAADALAESAEAGMIVETATGRWQFAHTLVRDVIERDLAPSRRATYHARAGVALERWFGTPPAQLERITHHYVSGASVANALRALELVRLAGRRAMEESSFGAAARWLTTALDVEAMLEPSSPLRRRALWLELAKLLARDGQVERAADAFAAAESLDASSRSESDAVRTAFQTIAPALPQIVERFYELLFVRHPQLRGMFRRSSSVQRRMFGEAIAALADHADEPDWLRSHLEALGRRHAEYGVTEEMYGWARAAFLDAITSALKPGPLANEVRATWQRTLDWMAQLMLAHTNASASPVNVPTRELSDHLRSSTR